MHVFIKQDNTLRHFLPACLILATRTSQLTQTNQLKHNTNDNNTSTAAAEQYKKMGSRRKMGNMYIIYKEEVVRRLFLIQCGHAGVKGNSRSGKITLRLDSLKNTCKQDASMSNKSTLTILVSVFKFLFFL